MSDHQTNAFPPSEGITSSDATPGADLSPGGNAGTVAFLHLHAAREDGSPIEGVNFRIRLPETGEVLSSATADSSGDAYFLFRGLQEDLPVSIGIQHEGICPMSAESHVFLSPGCTSKLSLVYPEGS